MNKIDIAYIAGLVDGEAYIGIKKDGSLTNGRVNLGYHERIQIRMVDEEAIKFIAKSLGGNYYKEKPSVANGRPLYCYQASDKIACAIITNLLPYLRIKKRVANKVLELRKLKDNPSKTKYKKMQKDRWGNMREFTKYRLSESHQDKCQSLYEDCKAINAGITLCQ
jgi:hypothetical protein